ncbi:MAG: hypothetical protein N3B12_06400 [Armatimonadetes bacterium]|nr:hypothetical protein [Armatimonadota bacterium]
MGDKWVEIEAKAVACLETEIEGLLEFSVIPESFQKTMNTTSLVGRVFREVRLRSGTISCLTDRRVVDRMLYAILAYQNNRLV